MTHPKLRYIGTKQICAVAMNRADYNILRGWTLPADENGADEGYLVEYLDGGKPNLEGYAGYVSWSPREQFENAYRPVITTHQDGDDMDPDRVFEEIEAMIKSEGATDRRVTANKLREVIQSVMFIKPTGTLMICIITVKNGFTFTGESACVEPANFRENIGRRISYENALRKIWMPEGYLLAQKRMEDAISSETMGKAVTG